MKRIIYIATLLGLAACSSDDVVDRTATDPNEITYSVTTNSATRAANIYTAGSNIDGFHLYASQNGATALSPYFQNDIINYDSTTSSYYNPLGKRYWPNYSLDFFAIHDKTDYSTDAYSFTSPLKYQSEVTEGTNTIAAYHYVEFDNIKLRSVANEQDDILYATTTGCAKSDGTVALNFRHALAKLDFLVKNSTTNLYVEVQGLKLCNINMQGNLTFGTVSTTVNYATSTNAYSYYDNCEWTTTDETTISNYIKWADNTDESNNVLYDVYAPGASQTATDNRSILVIPQNYSAASYNSGWTGVYVVLTCRVYTLLDKTAFNTWLTENADATAADIHTKMLEYALPICATSSDGFVDLYIPVPEQTSSSASTGPLPEVDQKIYYDSKWKSGIHYTYTIVFGGSGNGASDSTGDQIFSAIEVTNTIDPWPNSSSTTPGIGL